ncbi:MAG: hypothetical protein JWP97_2775 [Labilithrix sp.]|nr:hypothetical protein [Labilithrix sp.]
MRIETEHFELSTDLPPGEAKRAAEALERMRLALLAVAWNRPADQLRITSRTAVVVLRDQQDFRHYSRERFAGLYSGGPRPMIFLYGPPDAWEASSPSGKGKTSVLLHELTHHLAAGLYGRQPHWFSEGLAQFLETMRISEDGKEATFGGVNLDAFAGYRSQRSSVRDVLAWRLGADDDMDRLRARYGVSWLLLHFLFNVEPAALAELQSRLAAGMDPSRAWSETFPKEATIELDARLDQYWRHGTMTKFTRPLPSVAVATVTRPITAADVLAIRARLAFTGALENGNEELAAEGFEEARQALVLEPGHAIALRLLLRGEEHLSLADMVDRLRRQVAQRAEDGEAWLMLSEVADRDSPEQEAAARRAVVLMPRNAYAYGNLARLLVDTKRSEAALPFATKAALLAPWSRAALTTYAATLFAVGRCTDALRTHQRAIDVSAEGVSRRDMMQLEARLTDYTTACGDALVARP